MQQWLSAYGNEFALLAMAHAIAVVSPGPDFLVTLRQAIQQGKSAALWTACGIGFGILVHVAYVILGVAVLLRDYPQIMLGFRIVGAGYLLWLAWQCLRSSQVQRFHINEEIVATHTPWQAWRLGFLTNALNPKATMFFLALYINIISITTPVLVQIGYGIWMGLVTGGWFALVGAFMVRAPVRLKFLKMGPWVDRILGALLVLIAVRLLWQ